MGRGSVLVAVAVASACTFGSPGGKGDSAGSIGMVDTGDDDGGMSSAPGDDGEEGGSAGMSADTGMATASASETGQPVDPDGPSTEGTSSTGGVDPSTSGSDGSMDATTAAESDDEGDPPGPGYPECASGEDSECGAGNNCVAIVYWGQITETVCGEGGCITGRDCDPPESGNSVPFCAQLSIPTCVLGCQGATCPAGMVCVNTDLGEVCAWD